MELDGEALQRQLREVRFTDLWQGCGVWGSALLAWHVYARPSAWNARGSELEDRTMWVTALVACALNAAAEESGLDAADGSGLLRLPLEQAGAQLADAAAAVHAICQVSEPPEELRQPLEALRHWLEHGDVDQRTAMLHIIGMTGQVLGAHAGEARTLGERMPALARAAVLSMVLGSSEPQAHGPYAGAPSLAAHDDAARLLYERCLFERSMGSLSKELEREYLLQRAALDDRWLWHWGEEDQPAERVQAALVAARRLLAFDAAHGTGPGTETEPWRHKPRAYVRRQWRP